MSGLRCGESAGISYPEWFNDEKNEVGDASQESPGLVFGAKRAHIDKAWGCVVSNFPEEGWIGRNLSGLGSYVRAFGL